MRTSSPVVGTESALQPFSNPSLRCIECAAETSGNVRDFRCSGCGDLLEVVYERNAAPFDIAALRQQWMQRRLSNLPADQSGVWRFRELLPLTPNFENLVSLREGNTPLYDLPRCADAAGLDFLIAKHQGLNPTGSFKDTGMTTAMTLARQSGYRWVACASTGNTSASMAAFAARAGMRSLMLIPQSKIAWGKLAQALDYGALTCQLQTDFDGCVRVLNQLLSVLPVYLVNSVNPYRIEGQKTAAVELMEQLEWRLPDHVILPGGNLANSSAFGKAFIELHELGLIPRLPRISVIQAEGANALVRSLRENGGRALVPVQAETMATAIRIGRPASWKKAVRVLSATNGFCEDVSEEEIAIAKAQIGADGIGCEPASAASLAGLKKLVRSGKIRRSETVVLILTGHLLKDPEYTLNFHTGKLFERQFDEQGNWLRYTRSPVQLEPNADAVLREVERNSQ